MPAIRLTTRIHAPIERCFDLSRSIDLHLASTAQTGEQPIGAIQSGLLSLGESVTWRARHFGVWQELTSRITIYDRPHHFRDSQVDGAFRRFDHDHEFSISAENPGTTVVLDVFDYDAPYGILGWAAEWLLLTSYLRRFLITRNDVIKKAAEGDDWRKYLTQA